jgi:hypothetical protein
MTPMVFFRIGFIRNFPCVLPFWVFSRLCLSLSLQDD